MLCFTKLDYEGIWYRQLFLFAIAELNNPTLSDLKQQTFCCISQLSGA